MTTTTYRRQWRFFAGRFKGFGLGANFQTDEFGHEFEIIVGCFVLGGVYE